MTNPVRPQPISVPGSTWDASVVGVAPVSGQIGALSGPWLVEQQWMNISYTRVPNIQVSSTSPSLRGSRATTDQGNHLVAGYNTGRQVMSTELLCTITARYNRSSLGPQGTVITSQPYYSRRPWYAADTSCVKGIEAANFAVWTSGDFSTHQGEIESHVQTDYWKDFDKMSQPSSEKGSLIAAPTANVYTTERYPYWTWTLGNLPGDYSISQETLLYMIHVIDSAGSLVTGFWSTGGQGWVPKLFSIPASTYENLGQVIINTEMIPEYDANRHEY